MDTFRAGGAFEATQNGHKLFCSPRLPSAGLVCDCTKPTPVLLVTSPHSSCCGCSPSMTRPGAVPGRTEAYPGFFLLVPDLTTSNHIGGLNQKYVSDNPLLNLPRRRHCRRSRPFHRFRLPRQQ